jgi:acyl carrier protein
MASVFEVPVESLPDSFQQSDIESWDSLHHLNLIVELESAFDISYEPEEIGDMNSFEKVVNYTKEKVNQNA